MCWVAAMPDFGPALAQALADADRVRRVERDLADGRMTFDRGDVLALLRAWRRAQAQADSFGRGRAAEGARRAR